MGALALDAMLYSVKGEIESIIDKKCHNNKLYLGMVGFPVGALASKDTGCKSSARLKWWVCSLFHYSPQGTNTITNIANIATIATITTTTILPIILTPNPRIICTIVISNKNQLVKITRTEPPTPPPSLSLPSPLPSPPPPPSPP